MKNFLLLPLFACSLQAHSQNSGFTSDPSQVRFITTDIPNFWKAYDSIGLSNKNPFENYIKYGSRGLKGFIPSRIISADSLLSMVIRRKADYEKNRDVEARIREKEKEVLPYFYILKELYPKTKFPPVYFVFGRFNSGGTTSEDGLLVGAEMQTDMKGLRGLVIHESIHYQQVFPENATLLQLSILEGSADFISGLVTGGPVNAQRDDYARAHQDRLFKEFVERMNKTDIVDWLYGTSKKDDRPNDLGYWMGYKIVEAYYNKAADKKQAVDDILNIKDYNAFLDKSGFLNDYLK